MDIFDVTVIGGGITGVGITQALAAAGYKVELLEKDKIASKTSANSSKLIHGGLRYLESGQFNLVRQCLKERQTLLSLAPTLVHAVPFYIPIYKQSNRSPITIAAGLSLYSLLSWRDPLRKFEIVPKSNWPTLNNINQHNLTKVFKYWDAQTDDYQLTHAVAKSASNLGANIRENTTCDAIYHGAHMCSIHCTDTHQKTKNKQQKRSKLIINACGPWVNNLLQKVTPKVDITPIEWIQGSHLLLNITAPNGIYYLESPIDNRVIFVIPWKGKTLLGTTETPLQDPPANPKITQMEIDYLLTIYCHYFNNITYANLNNLIVETFCGVRVMAQTNKPAFEQKRDTVIKTYAFHPNLLTVYGGKLTGFRITAKQVVKWVQQQIGRRAIIADIDKITLLY